MANWLGRQVDSLISALAPRAGFYRLRARLAMDSLGSNSKKRRYEAAGGGRRVDDWKVNNSSANTENSVVARLRARSRDLDRNNPYAHRAVQRIADNVIGAGIRPTPIDKQSKKLKKAWETWAEKTTECDFDGRLTFYGIQRLIMTTVAMSGAAFVRLRRTNKNKKSGIPVQFQVFEPDIVDANINNTNITDPRNPGGYAVRGIEFDARGQRVGYWMWDNYPDDLQPIYSLVSKFVPVEDVLHIFSVERPGQSDGVPFGTSGFLRLRDFDEFEDAELVRQKIAACYAVFVSGDIDNPTAPVPNAPPLSEHVEPGMITKLAAGETTTFTNPPAKEGMGAYSQTVLRGIATAYGMTYEQLSNDLSNVNFSSGRMGWIESQRLYSHYQTNMAVPQFCQPAYDWFLLGAFIAGISNSQDMDVKWTPQRREMIDPVKETQALMWQVRSGFKSWGDAVSELGDDPEKVLDEIEFYNKEFDRRGITLDSDPRKVDKTGKDQVPPPSDDPANEDLVKTAKK